MKWKINLRLIFVFVTFLISTILYSNVFAVQKNEDILKIGVMVGPSEALLKTAATLMEKEYHIQIKPVVFTDYQIPNEALNAGDIDANLFQTQEFLDNSITAKGYKIQTIANTFIYPMGIYSKKIKTLNQLKKNAVVLIPNDASNRARARALLNHAGLKNLKIIEMSAAQIARSLPDADIVVLNNDFVMQAGFKFSDALFEETSESAAQYINVLAARKDTKKTEMLNKFISVIHSKEYELETYKFYPGAVKSW